MSREVRITNMPEEEKSLFSEGMNKLVATTIGLLLIAVIGQGLIIWKNQDTILSDILELKETEVVTHKLSDRLLQLESAKVVAYGRLRVLEDVSTSAEKDKYQRGGSFRRNDAIAMEKELGKTPSSNKERISQLEWKMETLAKNTDKSLDNEKDDVRKMKNNILSLIANMKAQHIEIETSLNENSTEDNIRHASLHKSQSVLGDGLISLNNEFEAYRDRVDKVLTRCEERMQEEK